MVENNKKRNLSELETDGEAPETTQLKIPKTENNKDTENNNDEKKEKPCPSKSFVFGSTTPFGNMGGFKMLGSGDNLFSTTSKQGKIEEKKNTEENNLESLVEKSAETKGEEKENDKTTNEQSKDIQEETAKESEKLEESKPTPKVIFGSGSTFGNAFQEAINKKSIFDEDTNKKNEENDGAEDNDSTAAKDVYKKVHLEKQDVKSGEENEETIFQIKAKLYHMELSKISLGWKEKGFGVIKVNKFIKSPSENYTSRLIMRQNGNLKLILNTPIVKEFKILKGMPSSLTGNKFIRLQLVENDEPVQYAIKVGQSENAEKLYDTIQGQIPK
jgi:Ran-binding protein 3